MKKLFYITMILMVASSCSPKLKVISLNDKRADLRHKDNYYLKDLNNSLIAIEQGKWFWSNEKDSLYMKFDVSYKKKNPDYKNVYFDEAYAKIKFISDDKIIYDNIDTNINDGIPVTTYSIYYNHYDLKYGFQNANMILLNLDELAVTFVTKDKKVSLFGKRHKVEVPRRFVLKRMY